MIKTRTPYYIDVPFVSEGTGVTCYAFILKVYIWTGLKDAPPTAATWEVTIENPESLTSDRKINIGNLINSFIDFQQQDSTTALIDGVNQLWVKASVTYQQTSDLVYEGERDIFTQLAIKGYGGGIDGENPDTPTDLVLITGRDFNVNKGGRFIIPLALDTPTYPTPLITITNITDDGGGDFTFTYTAIGNYASLDFILITDTVSIPIESTDVDGVTTVNVAGSGIVKGKILGFDIDSSQIVISNLYTI